MSKADLDFSDKSLSPDERLGNLMALTRGTVFAMHDLFRRIDSYNELLADELEDNPIAAGFLDKSRKCVTRGLDCLEAFDNTVADDDRSDSFDAPLMLEGIVKRCRRILSDVSTIRLNVPEEEVVIPGTLFQLQELFMNIVLEFSKRYLEEEGELAIIAAVRNLDRDFFELLGSRCAPGRYLVVSVSVGEDDFDEAAQCIYTDELLKEIGHGDEDDLILLQNYGITLGHRGDIFFQHGPSETITVSIVLPVSGKRKEMQAHHNIDDDSLYGDETILLVDDEDMIWDVIIDMLQELGYSVILAGNGEEAVETYRANPGEIDLVLLDMVMPKLDGHHAFFEMKEIDPDVCVLLSSGYVSEEDVSDVLDAGAAGFLLKPYRMVDLAARIRDILDDPLRKNSPAE